MKGCFVQLSSCGAFAVSCFWHWLLVKDLPEVKQVYQNSIIPKGLIKGKVKATGDPQVVYSCIKLL